jgi:hypothetical protein
MPCRPQGKSRWNEAVLYNVTVNLTGRALLTAGGIGSFDAIRTNITGAARQAHDYTRWSTPERIGVEAMRTILPSLGISPGTTRT